ncbi:MAG TPA: preprotein translocase subunit SecG [Planctomycetota bacterium]|nr:preprotein translocase subunit SecG [Planctomycetota bacterium]
MWILFSTLLYILFVVAAIVLVVVILLQEGRGGGFGEALGSHGRETFGVGSRGINTFTAVTAGIFLGSALLIHIVNRIQAEDTVFDGVGAPAIEGRSLPVGAPPGGINVPPAQPPPQTPTGN